MGTKKILIAYDGSQPAQKALSIMSELAKIGCGGNRYRGHG